MICGEHGCPVEQCADFSHANDTDDVDRAWVKGLARGIELALESGISIDARRTEIGMLLRYIRERL